MTDQFEFEPEDRAAAELDPHESEQAAPDRRHESLDEGYLPTAPRSEPAAAAEETIEGDGGQFEQRPEQEEPEIEDDWDEGLDDDRADRGGPDR